MKPLHYDLEIGATTAAENDDNDDDYDNFTRHIHVVSTVLFRSCNVSRFINCKCESRK
jgi:hypothetical protein